MSTPKRTPAEAALTDLVLDVFRLSSRMLAAGDKLVADLGLTSARWQILGSIVTSGRAQPVAWLARDMGGNRQNVQRIVNDLEQEGFVEFQPNPHHRRAQLVVRATGSASSAMRQAVEQIGKAGVNFGRRSPASGGHFSTPKHTMLTVASIRIR